MRQSSSLQAAEFKYDLHRIVTSADFWVSIAGALCIGIGTDSAWIATGVWLVATATRRRGR